MAGRQFSVFGKAGPFVRRKRVSGVEDENRAVAEIEFGRLPGGFIDTSISIFHAMESPSSPDDVHPEIPQRPHFPPIRASQFARALKTLLPEVFAL